MKIPIRTRLAAIYCAVFCLSTVALELAAYASLASSIDAVVDSELRARLNGVSGFLVEHVDRKTLPALLNELSGHFALQPELLEVARDGDGEIFRGDSMAGVSVAQQPGAAGVFSTVATSAGPVRLLSASRVLNQRRYVVSVGTDLAVPAEMLRRFRWLILFSSPLVFACAFIAGYTISNRALAPVSRLNKAARSIGAGNLASRLAVPDSRDELQDLAETLNGMLGRIENAFRHVTQFTANASHELRAPLALIRATSEVALLRVNGDAESYREALHRILRETEKNSALLDDMLRLARADASTISLVLKPLEFASHIERLCERVQPLAVEKNIRLELRPSEGLFFVLADADQLKRLWLILLDNAIKYTPAGGSITVSWRAVSPQLLVCEVRDTGIGIAEPDLPHIFERFYRADKARSRAEGGAGLGLAIARWIVDAHRAGIEVDSLPGRGSAFRVLLPTIQPRDRGDDAVDSLAHRLEPSGEVPDFDPPAVDAALGDLISK